MQRDSQGVGLYTILCAVLAIVFVQPLSVLAASWPDWCAQNGGEFQCQAPILTEWRYGHLMCQYQLGCDGQMPCTDNSEACQMRQIYCEVHRESNCSESIVPGAWYTAGGPSHAPGCGIYTDMSQWPIKQMGVEVTNAKPVALSETYSTHDTPACASTSSGQTHITRDRNFVCPYGMETFFLPDSEDGEFICYAYDRLHIGCNGGQSCPSVGNPLNPATGNKHQREHDLVANGLLKFERFYNSAGEAGFHYSTLESLSYIAGAPWLSNMGAMWRHTYDRSLSILGTEGVRTLSAYRQDGSVMTFSLLEGVWRSDVAGASTLQELRNEDEQVVGYLLSGLDGAREQYSLAGRLEKIENLSGERVELHYAGDRLDKVVDGWGRELVFTYGPDNMLSSVQSPDGETIHYRHDESLRLVDVAYPGIVRPRKYHYENEENPFALTGISDEAGHRFSTYQYDDAGKVSSSEHAGGVGRFSVDYSRNDGGMNLTSSVMDPLGKVRLFTYANLHGAAKIASLSEGGNCSGCGVSGTEYRKTYDANGNLDLEYDFNGIAVDYDFSDRGLEITRREGGRLGASASCPAGSEFYDGAYGSDCNAGSCWATSPFRGSRDASELGYPGWQYSCPMPALPTLSYLRRVETAWHDMFLLPVERRTFNESNDLVGLYRWTYNSRGQPLAATQVEPVAATTRTVTNTYCEQSDVDGGTCPMLGLRLSIDGPRTDVADVVTHTYYPSDDASCATSPTTCPYRKGDLWKVTNALGQVTEYLRYDGAGRVLSMRDSNGVVTDFQYHPRGWLTARKVRGTDNSTETDDQITGIDYWPTGLVKRVIQPDGAFTEYTYDPAHRLTDITDNAGNTIHYTLDNAGNRLQEDTRDPNGTLKRTLSRVYNQLGQLQTQADAQSNPTDFTYDANDNSDTITDALNRVTDHDYDPLNRLQRTLQDVGGIAAETKFEYDALDNLTKVTDPKGLETAYAYNGFGDLVRLNSPDTSTTTYTYDSAGNRTSQTDARGVTTAYAYDALNRLTSVDYPDDSLNTNYVYDIASSACAAGETFAIGRLSEMTDGSGSTRYCYDRFGHLMRKVQTTNGRTFTLRYAYTKAGHLSSVTYPDGAVVDYIRNAAGQIAEVGVTPAGGVRQVLLDQASYAPFGPTTGWTYGNGRALQRPLDLDYRPLAVRDGRVGGLDVGFGFDAVGNLDALTMASSATPLLDFGYDALNRLTQTKDAPTDTPIETYAYDATGNRTGFTNSAGAQAYAYPAGSHRLASIGGVARTYDAAGNTTSIGGTAHEFVYNDAGRMSQAKSGGAVVASYAYNGRGERVRKTAGSTDTYTLYDEAGHWLGDYDDTGAPKQQAIWLDDLPVGLLAGPMQQLHYIEPDHLGTPRVVIDPIRDVAVWKWDAKSEAFGNSPPHEDPDADGTAFVLDMRFPGQRYDAASGLDYNYARDYEPSTGRYAQSDLAGIVDGPSTYGYAKQNPLVLIDSHGNSARPGPGYNFENHKELARSEAIVRMQQCNIDKCSSENPYSIDDTERSQIIGKLVSAGIELDLREPICGVTNPNYDSNRIVVGGAMLSGRCACSMAALLAHEATHLVLGRSIYLNIESINEGKARQVAAQCFNCSGAFH